MDVLGWIVGLGLAAGFISGGWGYLAMLARALEAEQER